MSPVTFNIEFEREDDGRWLAEVMELPGVMVYGATANDAIRGAEALAFRVLADRLEHKQEPEPVSAVHFVPRAA